MFRLIFSLLKKDKFISILKSIQLLNSINPIHSLELYFLYNFFLKEWMTLMFLKEFKVLKYLRIDFVHFAFDIEFLKELSKNLLNLEQLVISTNVKTKIISKEVIMQFVRNSPQLKLLISNQMHSLDENDLNEFNEARIKLNGAVHIIAANGSSFFTYASKSMISFQRYSEENRISFFGIQYS